MITQVFSVYDQRASVYLPPMYMQNKGFALRSFEDAINDQSHQFARHPGDYTLVHLGEFDDCSGKFSLLDMPNILINGLECVKNKE